MQNHPKWGFHAGLRRLKVALALGGIIVGINCRISSAQTDIPPVIKVESHEVVLPIQVIQETKSTGAVVGSNGEIQLGWVLRAKEVNGLSAKSVHIFHDGVETKIQHFSVEKGDGWEVRDNTGGHLNYSCTPRSFWMGPNTTGINDSKVHTYLVTYVPPPSPAGSCHQISIKIDRKHSMVFAPSQYCNTKDPLSDPLKQTELGNRLLAYADSKDSGDLPVSLQVVPFLGPSGVAWVNLSAHLPATLMKRHWEEIHLTTSIAVLGLVLDRKGTLIARFSDIACAPGEDYYEGPLPMPAWAKEANEQAVIPNGYQTQVDLDPGDYRMELLLTDGEKFGRASASFTVDDFSSASLSMSGIALCKSYHRPSPDERGPTRAPQYVPLTFNTMEFTPAGDTHFKRGQQLMTYAEIYGSGLRTAGVPKVYLEMKVTDEKTNELKFGTGVRPVDLAPSSHGSTIPAVWTLALDKLPAGSYRLEAQASDSEGHKTDWRKASFNVD